MLFDVCEHQWSNEILSSIGLDKTKLSNPVASGKIVGTNESNISKNLGFTKQVSIVTGGHDQTVAALGAGVTEPGICMYATGTVECFCPMLEKPSFTPDLMACNLCCYDYTIENKYTTGAPEVINGLNLKPIS